MKFVTVKRDCSAFQPPLTQQQLTQLCRRAFADQAGNGDQCEMQASEQLFTGKFNTTYRIDLANHRQVILRVAPPASAPLFIHEKKMLQREHTVQPALTVITDHLPKTLFADFSKQLIDRDYVFLSFKQGELWDDIKEQLQPEHNLQLWQQLGSLVKKIHAVKGSAFGMPSPMPQHSRWSEALISNIEGMRSDLERFGVTVGDSRLLLDLLHKGRGILDAIDHPVLLHGDLWPKNILIDRSGKEPKISALLDSERAFWGDPAAEWIFSYLDIPQSFWQAYGNDFSESQLSEQALFRHKAYESKGAIQLVLEGWRFNFDTDFARIILADALSCMSTIIKNHPSITSLGGDSGSPFSG